MKLKKLTQRGITHYVLPLAVVVLVAVVGTALLIRSHAATPSYLGFANYTTASTYSPPPRPGVTAIKPPVVFTSQDFLPGIGAQSVSDLSPGAKLKYANLPGKVYFSQICYYVRVYNSPKATTQVRSANVAFLGINKAIDQSLPVDSKYRSVCVPSGSSTSNTSQLPYSVWNRSSSAYVLVYQAVLYY